MSRPASLERLREISKQRSIRRPLLVPVPNEGPGELPESRIEWPIAG
jgi:hypothetical protein